MTVDPVVGFVLFVGVVALVVGFLTLVARACDRVEAYLGRRRRQPSLYDWAERDPDLTLPSSHIRLIREQPRKGAA